jgi:predicted RNA binding protein YcfA (HicA-like mRNA interferase family)
MASILRELKVFIHRQFKHPDKAVTVTVFSKPSVDVPIGTLKNIWRQAQMEED